MQIRPNRLIQIGGLAIGITIAAPSVLGCFYYLLNPSEVADNVGGAVFCFTLGPLCSYFTCRWVRIGGTASDSIVKLRGMWATTMAETQQVAEVREYLPSRGDVEKRYELIDHRGESLGVIPKSLRFCREWPAFLSYLRKRATESRRLAGNTRRSIQDKPAGKWTAEDIETYEDS